MESCDGTSQVRAARHGRTQIEKLVDVRKTEIAAQTTGCHEERERRGSLYHLNTERITLASPSQS